MFTAFLFLGMGVGFLLDELVVGLFVGMGLGFLAMAIVRGIGMSKARAGGDEGKR